MTYRDHNNSKVEKDAPVGVHSKDMDTYAFLEYLKTHIYFEYNSWTIVCMTAQEAVEAGYDSVVLNGKTPLNSTIFASRQ